MNSGYKGNVLVITYWSYRDALIQTYTLPYVRIIRRNISPGSRLFLVTLEHSWPESAEDRNSLEAEGIKWIPFRYYPFGMKGMTSWITRIFSLTQTIRRHNVTVLHAWCTPAGAAGYLLSKLTGRRLILDSFEPHAEAMVENGSWKKGGLPFRILFWLEKKQAHRAFAVISATEGMRDYALRKYGATFEYFVVKPACVNLDHFSLKPNDTEIRSALTLDGMIVCVYAGKFGDIYLDQEVFDFFAACVRQFGERFRVLLLTNQNRDDIDRWIDRAGIDRHIVINTFVPHQEIPRYLRAGDFAITPVKPVPSKRYCTPIKNGEYWALGLPVVIPPGISDDSDIILKHKIGAVLTGLSTQAYEVAAKTIDDVLREPGLKARIRNIAIQYRNYEIAENIYRDIYGQQTLDK